MLTDIYKLKDNQRSEITLKGPIQQMFFTFKNLYKILRAIRENMLQGESLFAIYTIEIIWRSKKWILCNIRFRNERYKSINWS